MVWARKIRVHLGRFRYDVSDTRSICSFRITGRDSSSSLYMYTYVTMIISPNQAPHRHGSLAVVEPRGHTGLLKRRCRAVEVGSGSASAVDEVKVSGVRTPNWSSGAEPCRSRSLAVARTDLWFRRGIDMHNATESKFCRINGTTYESVARSRTQGTALHMSTTNKNEVSDDLSGRVR